VYNSISSRNAWWGHFAQEIFVDAHFCDILGHAIAGAVALASQRQVAPMSQGMHL
jgi:hypothetical protein